MADKMFVACPRCGVFTQTERKLFGGGWKEMTCASCKMKYGYDERAAKIQTCDSCHQVVAYTEKLSETCPACGKALSAASQMRMTECPVCASPVAYKVGQTSVTCPNLRCGHTFNPEAVTQHVKSMVESSAPDIRMTGTMGEDQLIWRHDKLPQMLPLNAQIVAAPGMRAVGLKGTTVVFQADARNVQLSETELRSCASEYDGASVPLADVDVYYVRYNLGTQIPWGNRIFLSDAYGVRTEFKMHGDAMIETIEEPAAFLRTFGYDPGQVLRSTFSAQRDQAGYLHKHAGQVNARINSVLQRAMEAARDANGLNTADMEYHQDLIREEVERQANMALVEYGLKLSILRCTLIKGETKVAQDTLERRVSGPINWRMERPVRVHEAGNPTAWVELGMKGRFYVEVQDRGRFNACSDAYTWRDPGKSDNVARQEFTDMVVDQLYSCFKTQLQLIADETACSLDSLDNYEATLRRKACALLNGEDGFFGSRGLAVRDMTVIMMQEKKSAVFSGQESLAEDTALNDIARGRGKLETAAFADQMTEQQRREAIKTGAAVADIERSSELEEAKIKAELRSAELREMMARQQRGFEHDSMLEKQRMLQEQDEFDYERRRRAHEEKQRTEVSDAEHEARLKDIARRIEESDLAWNEKLDAYARLQRGIAFRDKMDEREALAEANAREQRLARVLRAEDMQAMSELRREEDLHQENLEKQRFARELELRRQKMAEDTARLQAEFERERAIAQEHEIRMKAREEVETLRLMLEYLARSGEQQVTAEALREARQEAQLTWEREHAENERKAAQERDLRHQQAEKDMVAQAMQLIAMANDAQKTAATREGRESRAAVADIQQIIDQLTGIREALEGKAGRKNADTASDLDSWFNGFLSRIGKHGAASRPAARPKGVGAVCVHCGKVFDESAYRCPHCGEIS
ncbi:MAG: hypothetical protein IKK57_12460 [Clostridia bacterium]|nr:hypothetical protein [Clostridia bacterium]